MNELGQRRNRELVRVSETKLTLHIVVDLGKGVENGKVLFVSSLDQAILFSQIDGNLMEHALIT